MRLRLPVIFVVLTWLTADSPGARGGDGTTVDPFLQAAQWAEEAGDVGEDAFDLEDNGELIACGDEVGMAGLIEPDRRRRSRWTVLTELPVLLPSYSTSTLATANDHPIIGPRLVAGWEGDAGFGVRGRAWWFDSAVEVNGEPLAASNYNFLYLYPSSSIYWHQINFSGGKLDLDFYKRFEHATGDMAFGLTLTAAEMTLRDRYYSKSFYTYYNQPLLLASYSANGSSVVRNRGAGLGLMAEGSHRLLGTPANALSVFGRGRLAYLIGEWENSGNALLREGDGNMAIGEAALGLEYRRQFRRADLLVQCAFEVQSWDVSQAGRVNFAGVTPSVGLNW